MQRLTLDSPVGRLVLEGTDEVLTRVYLPNHAPQVDVTTTSSSALARTAEQLGEYFEGARTVFDVPLAPTGTPFQLEVWRQLSLIPYGEVITYAQLAQRVERPKGFRAVGQANGRNPLAIIVPCHRVVASDGLGGYAGGPDLKRRLLDLETRTRAA
ncbi:MAG: methylated-DNA--[protein]-cysteine S-methyltransferase [Acidobacteriota bacterium]|nr:methylated-DNA--[protein]-cysteine S-methyltransferase [Acidobacteriota bacterium]